MLAEQFQQRYYGMDPKNMQINSDLGSEIVCLISYGYLSVNGDCKPRYSLRSFLRLVIISPLSGNAPCY
jgi:hypothetical protein